MSLPWIWIEELPSQSVHALATDEARHVSARRLRVGGEIVVFDGRGRSAPARIAGMARKHVEIEIGDVSEAVRPDPGLRLATAIPKGERLSMMLQMLTQLGLAIWQPLVLDDSALRKLDVEGARMRRILIEACKVARRLHTMEVRPVCSLSEALAACEDDARIHFGDREGAASGFESSPGVDWAFVGPEAGFSDDELGQLRAAGARPQCWSPHNLRIETAAVAACSCHHATGTASRSVSDSSFERGVS